MSNLPKRAPLAVEAPAIKIIDLGFLAPEPGTAIVKETLHLVGCLLAATLVVMASFGACFLKIGG